MKQSCDFSIVIPVYYNEGSLRDTMHALQAEVLVKQGDYRGEVLFIDDGSGDGSFRVLQELQREHPSCVRVIKLSRNFGQVSALWAGFEHARGRCVVVLSADGQDPPALINEMLRCCFEEQEEVVIAVRASREESWMRILTSRLFYWMMRKLCFANMPAGGFDFFLLGSRALDAMRRNREAHPFLQGQILWTGFKPRFMEYTRRQRTAGTSKWTFGKRLTYLIDGVLSYSFLPLRFISFAGLLLALLGFIYALFIIIVKLLGATQMVYGWAPIMIAVLVIGGAQMIMLGVIGEYLWRTLAQARNRELYVIDEVLESPAG